MKANYAVCSGFSMPVMYSRDRNLETETSSKNSRLRLEIRDRDSEIGKYLDLTKFSKNVITTSNLNFFEFVAFYLGLKCLWYLQVRKNQKPVLTFPYLQVQPTIQQNMLNFRNFTNPYRCSIQSLKTLACDRDLKSSRPRLAKMCLGRSLDHWVLHLGTSKIYLSLFSQKAIRILVYNSGKCV